MTTGNELPVNVGAMLLPSITTRRRYDVTLRQHCRRSTKASGDICAGHTSLATFTPRRRGIEERGRSATGVWYYIGDIRARRYGIYSGDEAVRRIHYGGLLRRHINGTLVCRNTLQCWLGYTALSAYRRHIMALTTRETISIDEAPMIYYYYVNGVKE